jgi:uncharacterized protein (TIGR03000 family)
MFIRNVLGRAVLSLTLAAIGAGTALAQAPYHGSWGSSGGSYGSYGSRGSSGGSWGSSGGSWGSSGGSWGSSGGSYGSYGSSGGSSGSSGSWGGQPVYPQTRAETPAENYSAFDTRARAGNTAERDELLRKRPREAQRALVELEVPEDSIVSLNGQRMTLVGSKRTYVSQPLDSGKQYVYSIEVQAVRNHRSVKASLSQKLKAGQVVQLEAVFKDAGNELVLRPSSKNDGAIASRQSQ